MTLATVAVDLSPFPTEYWQGGAVGLLGIVFLMMCLGWLVPRTYYKQVVAERDYWRNIAMKAVEQSDELLPAAQITTQVARALADRTSNAVERALSGMPQQHPDDEARVTWLQRLLPWLRTEDTTEEAKQQMAKLERRAPEVTRLGLELREVRRRNHFSGMVDNAIHHPRIAREGP